MTTDAPSLEGYVELPMLALGETELVNPLSSPNHWWHKRGARSEGELQEFAAWKFVARRDLEIVLWVEANAPELFGHVATDVRSQLAAYVRGRSAALRQGRTFRLNPPWPGAAVLSEAVATIRGHDSLGQADAYARGQAAFAAAVERGDWPHREWVAWKEGCVSVAKAEDALRGARSLLGLRVDSVAGIRGLGPDPLLAEIDRLTGHQGGRQ